MNRKANLVHAHHRMMNIIMVDVTFASGTSKHYEGAVTLTKAGGIHCPVNFSSCIFGVQFGGTGFNPNLPTRESGC